MPPIDCRADIYPRQTGMRGSGLTHSDPETWHVGAHGVPRGRVVFGTRLLWKFTHVEVARVTHPGLHR